MTSGRPEEKLTLTSTEEIITSRMRYTRRNKCVCYSRDGLMLQTKQFTSRDLPLASDFVGPLPLIICYNKTTIYQSKKLQHYVHTVRANCL